MSKATRKKYNYTKKIYRKSCRSKQKFKTRFDAVNAIINLRLYTGTQDFLQIYLCRYANHYHFGHRKINYETII